MDRKVARHPQVGRVCAPSRETPSHCRRGDLHSGERCCPAASREASGRGRARPAGYAGDASRPLDQPVTVRSLSSVRRRSGRSSFVPPTPNGRMRLDGPAGTWPATTGPSRISQLVTQHALQSWDQSACARAFWTASNEQIEHLPCEDRPQRARTRTAERLASEAHDSGRYPQSG